MPLVILVARDTSGNLFQYDVFNKAEREAWPQACRHGGHTQAFGDSARHVARRLDVPVQGAAGAEWDRQTVRVNIMRNQPIIADCL